MFRLFVIVLVGRSSPNSPVTDASSDGSSPSPDAPPMVACSKPAQPLDATWTVAGRTVNVHVPASYDPTRPTPIVLGLHGLDASGAKQASVSRMNARADAAGFIAIYPNGTGSP